MSLLEPHGARQDGWLDVSKVVAIMAVLSVADLAAAPALGYARDHILNGFFRWLFDSPVVNQGAVVPLIRQCTKTIVGLFSRIIWSVDKRSV